MADLSVFVGSAVWRQVEPLHMKSLLSLLVDVRKYAYFPQVGDALIERARGINATYFLRHTKADVYLSLDSDIVEFKKEAIDQMCEQAVEYDIVGGAYICKSVARTFPSSLFLDDTSIEFGFDPTPKEVQWAATGCLAVHRRVFEKMAETLPLLHEKDGPRAFYPFFQSMIHEEKDAGKILLSEDFAFCQRARDLGFVPHINPSVRVGHMGPYAYRLEDMAQQVLQPQPVKISRSGGFWRIEAEGTVETPEAHGRIIKGKRPDIEKRFKKLDKKALTTASP